MRRGRCWCLAVAAIVLSAACATDLRFRPKRGLSASSDGLAVEIAGLESRFGDAGIAIVSRVSAPEGTALREASLALPGSTPCQDHDEAAAAFDVDGSPSWPRPVPLAGAHRLTLRFPQTLGLTKRLSGPLAIDLTIAHADRAACLRIGVQDEGERATWTPVSSWMAGLRVDAAPVGFGVRGGRFFGPIVVGIEDTISLGWSTAAIVATAHIYEAIGLEGSYAGRWALPGGSEPAGSFRNGPRVRVFLAAAGGSPFDGRRIFLGGLGLEVGRWWAAGAEPAATTVVFGFAGWVNVLAH